MSVKRKLKMLRLTRYNNPRASQVIIGPEMREGVPGNQMSIKGMQHTVDHASIGVQ